MKNVYKAVTREGLKIATGDYLSPIYEKREGFVIGPDAYGRMCHVASCWTLEEAKRYAKKMNESIK